MYGRRQRAYLAWRVRGSSAIFKHWLSGNGGPWIIQNPNPRIRRGKRNIGSREKSQRGRLGRIR